MTKTVAMTLGERVAAITLFKQAKTDLETVAILLEDVKKIVITEAEWKEANLVKTPVDGGKEQWNWDESKTKDIELEQKAVDYLIASIKAKSDAKEISLEDAAMITLEKKLK